jgi:hypothetical protein
MFLFLRVHRSHVTLDSRKFRLQVSNLPCVKLDFRVELEKSKGNKRYPQIRKLANSVDLASIRFS